nr:reverse transcriptase domain-containing protein [Tanacetum cinerariifolium]
GSNRKLGENKILTEGEISGISRDQSEDVTISHSSQNPQRKFGFRQRQRITQSFSPNLEISFPTLKEENGAEGPLVIKAEIGATAPFIGFSRERIWPMGQRLLPVKISDEEHSTFTWMNFVVVRSSSPYNRIIGRPGVMKIQAVPSIAHGMLKFLVLGGILTLWSSRIIPLECTMVSGPEA